MKKIIALVLSLVLATCVLAACGGGATSENAVTVTVKFVAEGKEFYTKEVTVNADEPTVLNAVEKIYAESTDIDITFDNINSPTTIASVNDYTEGDSFWDFKIGDDMYGANGRAVNAKISDGDVITWGYMTIDEFAALEEAAA
ncbi:MAG: hypothetical protein IKT46_05435 [Clostridia bacterium]|nr:hypothetical protein [Clostridia bacterium]